MTQGHDTDNLIAVESLQEYFRQSLDAALANQNIAVDAHTAHYVVNLLTVYARADRLYEHSQDGYGLKPLAFMMADALESGSERERRAAWQRLGDVSLFVAGFFAHSFARRLVDIDYYIGMGGNAYARLSETMRGRPGKAGVRGVFDELAAKFQRFVDALNEVSESACGVNDTDVMRLYEIWLRTGSRRAERQLRRAGVVPVAGPGSLKRQ